MKYIKRFIPAALGAAGGVLAVHTYRRFKIDIKTAEDGILTGSTLAETEVGLIEYATTGDGKPVLLLHGAGGGYDQGLLVARMVGDGYQFIAVSRFGYLGTPLPPDGSPAAQADAYAALMDILGIQKVAVVGISAGGPSSLQFALRHPQRCEALVMLSAVSIKVPVPISKDPAIFKSIFQSEFITWLLIRLLSPALLALFGVPFGVRSRLSTEERAFVREFMDTLMPVNCRYEGTLNDLDHIQDLDRYPIEQILVPTLVVHAADDSLVVPRHAHFTAGTIPGARLFEVPSGGHILLGHHAEVKREVAAFLDEIAEKE